MIELISYLWWLWAAAAIACGINWFCCYKTYERMDMLPHGMRHPEDVIDEQAWKTLKAAAVTIFFVTLSAVSVAARI